MSPHPPFDCGVEAAPDPLHGWSVESVSEDVTVYRHEDVTTIFRCACGKPFVPVNGKQKTCGAPLCTRRLERAAAGQRMRIDLASGTCMYCQATFRPKSSRNVKACAAAECQRKRKSRVVVHEPRPCSICGGAFVPRTARNVLCSTSSCKITARDQRFTAWYAKPINVETHRDKSLVRKATAHGAIISTAETSRQPWLLAAPAYGSHLPGGGLEIAISPPPKWPLDHRNVRALHGLLTGLIDEPHGANVPGFSLVPWPVKSGWGVYLRDDAHAARLAGKVFRGGLFGREVEISFSTTRRIRAPQIAKRGRVLVRIDALTPVCIRNGGGSTTYTAPIASNLLSAIVQSFPQRLGLVGLDPAAVLLEIVERHTEPATVHLGGKFGSIRGWTGHVIVEANAVARWLLACAGLIGLGGRTALGFGRVRVSEVSC